MVEAQTYAQKAARRDAEPLRKDRLVTERICADGYACLAPDCSCPDKPKPSEADDLLTRFMDELAKPTGDGQQKRKKGKPPWYVDTDHHRAMFSHYHKWLAGEKVDPDSGASPLVHLAWRALALACQETGNVPSTLTAEQQVL